MSEWMKELERLVDAHEIAISRRLNGAAWNEETDASRAALLAHAAQRDVQPEPSGWRLVPVEPTDAMLGAGLKHIDGMASMPGAYRAMLDAAPHPVESPQSVGPCKQINSGHVCGAPRRGSERVCPDCNPQSVELPEPNYRGPASAGTYFDGYNATTLRTYGDAREAAGYARGLKEGVARAGLTPAEHDVLTERQRQINVEGWTPERDDNYTSCELAAAASCYAGNAGGFVWAAGWPEKIWPWSRAWWKPSAPRRDLVKAGALIIAEIERQDRAVLAGEVKP